MKTKTLYLFLSFETLFWYFVALTGFITIVNNDIPNWLAMAWELGYGLPIALLIAIHFFKLDNKITRTSTMGSMYNELLILKHLVEDCLSSTNKLPQSEKIAELEIWRNKQFASYFSMHIFRIQEIIRSNSNLTELSTTDKETITNFYQNIDTRMHLIHSAVPEIDD